MFIMYILILYLCVCGTLSGAVLVHRKEVERLGVFANPFVAYLNMRKLPEGFP